MPIVTGLFQHEEGARRAIAYLQEIGVDRRIIEVETYDDTAEKTLAIHRKMVKRAASSGAKSSAPTFPSKIW
ncbi:hypothetical protein [Agrobacterium pusense]|uniref:hypothetical protein n=1 Tax=Agrobacterium pusense TaxID=648995 RepID=UPI00289BF25C|nr:hypothetical protein [Agrobacterium pusense]